MRTLPLALAALLLATAFLPAPAQAQFAVCGVASPTCQTTVEVLVMPHDGPIMPDAGYVAMPVTVRYTYFNTAPLTFSPTQIDLHVAEAPPWSTATLSPSSVFIPVSQTSMDGSQRVASAQAFLLVSTSVDAPAFHVGQVGVMATARPNGALTASQGRNAIPVVADFFALTDVRAPTTQADLQAGRPFVLPTQLTNFGNGPVRLTFTVLSAPEGVQVTPPPPLVLESRQQGAEHNFAGVNWRIEGKPGFQEGDVLLLVESRYALDDRVKGDEVKVAIHVERAEGGDVSVQGMFGPGGSASGALVMGLLAAGAAGTVMLERHRRQHR